jgi:hypothetical protein
MPYYPPGFTLPTLTAGSVIFSNGTTLAQDNANFFWDDTNNRLGISDATPDAKLDIVTAAATNIGLIIQGASAQSSNLTEWRDSDENILSYVDSNGSHFIGRQAVGDGTAYTVQVLRNGTAASPGTYLSTGGFVFQDFAGNGPAVRDDVGLVNFDFPRIEDTDTNAHNATIFACRNDAGWALRVDGRRNVFVGLYQSTNSLLNESLFVGKRVGIGVAGASASLFVRPEGTTTVGMQIEGRASHTANLLELHDTSSNIQVSFGPNGSAIFNEQGADADCRIEGDTATNLFLTDAGLDAVQIGTTTAGVIADFRSSAIVFNEDGTDRDIRFEGDTDANLIYTDASTDRVGIGTNTPLTKLHVVGAVTHTGSANNRATENKILYGATTDAATAVELTTDGAAGSGATNRISVPTDTALSVVLNICVKQSASANAKQMLRQFLISNNGGTTAIQGSVTTLGTDVESVGLATVTTTITANDTDDCAKIEVNGVLGTNLRYTAYVVSTETLYA